MIKKKVQKLIRLLSNDISVCFGKSVMISASISLDYDGKLFHSNWGDDLNYYFLKEISLRPIIIMNDTLIAKYIMRNYLAIGSTIGMITNRKTVVWGAGLMSEHLSEKIKVSDIKAVRGPLSRKVLMEQSVYTDCPTCYGDPALLLPLHYMPKVRKKYRIGIIPHYADVDRLRQLSNLADIHIIMTKNYKHWHDFIDEIVQCECLVSSSLHGLIVAEAYDIPSQWVEFGNSMNRKHFKYHDFYASIDKKAEVFIVDEETTNASLMEACKKWQKGTIETSSLIASCPFPINI